MDLVLALAATEHADVAIANDPDADRVAVGIPLPDGSWRRLSGNEVGALLGWRIAERSSLADRGGTLAASLVSSPALGEVARKYDLDFHETLTGFKWISRVGGLDLRLRGGARATSSTQTRCATRMASPPRSR